MDYTHLKYWCQTTNFHVCLHIFNANSIFMTLFGMDFQFQSPNEGIWLKLKMLRTLWNGFYTNLMFSDNNCFSFSVLSREMAADINAYKCYKWGICVFLKVHFSKAEGELEVACLQVESWNGCPKVTLLLQKATIFLPNRESLSDETCKFDSSATTNIHEYGRIIGQIDTWMWQRWKYWFAWYHCL